MMSALKKRGPRWSALLAEGKKVVLVGPESKWTVFNCETEAIAEHTVRELMAWAKHEFQTLEYKSLCQAGD